MLIDLPHVRFLEEMLPKFSLTLLKLMFNIYLILFLFFYVTPKYPPVLYGFGLGVENLGVLNNMSNFVTLTRVFEGICMYMLFVYFENVKLFCEPIIVIQIGNDCNQS